MLVLYHTSQTNLFLWPFVTHFWLGFALLAWTWVLLLYCSFFPPLGWVAWFNGVCQGFHQLIVSPFGKNSRWWAKLKKPSKALSKFFTNPSIIMISPSHPTLYWSHPIWPLLENMTTKYLTCLSHTYLLIFISFGTLRPKETLEHMTKNPTY